ncbi:MAG TPA: hypothetical protein DIW23_07245 [Anaerolineae bacterium]|nr:hypothetical protein [Anaerolineae bacterium]
MTFRFRFSGLNEAQQAMLEAAKAVSPSDGLGLMVQDVTMQAFRFQTSITHVDTGGLRGSQRMKMQKPARWEIYIDPSAKNRRSGQLVSSYAEIENARGGDHAFVDRTYSRADEFIEKARHVLLRKL